MEDKGSVQIKEHIEIIKWEGQKPKLGEVNEPIEVLEAEFVNGVLIKKSIKGGCDANNS